MFGPDYVAGCPTNSSIADALDPLVPHLQARDVTMICVSRAPLDKLLAYRERMGWSFNWASSYESDFNFDFEHSRTCSSVLETPWSTLKSLPWLDAQLKLQPIRSR